MPTVPMWRRYLRFLGADSRSDLDDEISFHLETRIDELREAGLEPPAARRRALREFGDVERYRSECRRIDDRDTRTRTRTEFWSTLLQDVRFGFRTLAKDPSITASALLAIALGIGCTTAIYTAVDSLLLRPLPYDHPEQITMVWEARIDRPLQNENVVSPANFTDWQKQSASFSAMSLFTPALVNLTGVGNPEQIPSQFVDRNFFPVLRTKPLAGRLIDAGDDRPNGPCVADISYRLWQTHFAGDPQVLGRSIRVNDKPCTVIGILPPAFFFFKRETQIWQPLGLDSESATVRRGRYLLSLGRLRDGISLRQAETEMKTIARRLEGAFPEFDKNWTVHLIPLREQLTQRIRLALLVLSAAVGFLLLIACANVANLLLARSSVRSREVAVRASLGASRRRLVRQLLTESVLLSLLGGLAGVVLAYFGVRALVAVAPSALGGPSSVSMDYRVLLFSLLLMVVTGVAFGLAPALSGSSGDLAASLKSGGRTTTAHGKSLRYLFTCVQVGLTVVLLAGAGLLLRSLFRIEAVDPGLDATRLLTFQVSLPLSKYDTSDKRVNFYRALQGRIRNQPDVEAVSAINFLPFNGMASGTNVRFAGRAPAKPGEEKGTVVRTISPGYFQTVRIPLLAGRDFTEADNQPTAPVRFVVNQSFARTFYPNENPLEQKIWVYMQDENPFAPIIGVVGDVKEGALTNEAEPTVYYVHGVFSYNFMNIMIRTKGDPMAALPAARRALASLDPDLPAAEPRTMEQVIARTSARQRFSAILLAVFASVALILAVIGTYGVLAYTVAERTPEIGVRLAVGAQVAVIFRMVVFEGMRVVLAGVAGGVLAALALTRLIRSMLFGTEPWDPATFAAIIAILLAAALLAILIPARQATSIDPVRALKYE
jgi:putative ABC transport system permease protein